MKLLEIINDEVVNVIEVDPDNVPDWCADWETLDESDNDCDVGSEKQPDGSWLRPQKNPKVMTERVRKHRDNLLVELDAVAGNPLRWAAMAAEEQTEWSTYRHALLNVPQQEGFPLSVTWPTKPK